jgi:hypothetical protein
MHEKDKVQEDACTLSQSLIFRGSCIDQFDDLCDLFGRELSGVSACLVYGNQEAVFCISGDDCLP